MFSTKIIATLGPACAGKKTVAKMVSTGVSAFRINTAYGSLKEYSSLVSIVQGVSSEVPIIIDLKGPELRLRCRENIAAKKGSELLIGFSESDPVWFSKNFHSKNVVGKKILFEDGKYSAKIVSKKSGKLLVRFHADAVLKNNKGVNIPEVELGFPSISAKDKTIVNWAKKRGLLFFALSFCRCSHDVNALRKLAGNDSVILAKIESKQGVKNFDEILEAADGVIVARGDLGAEVKRESIPLLQKRMIKKSINKGKFCVVATQMLESMISSPYPSRAEVNDIANSVLDGADCLMLSGETAVGVNPVGAVMEMKRASEAVEEKVPNFVSMRFTNHVSDSITKSIFQLSRYLKVNRIIAFTKSGFTAQRISRFRTSIPIIGLCWDKRTLKLLKMFFGVKPILAPASVKLGAGTALSFLKKRGLVKKGETIIFTGNADSGKKQHSNLIEVRKVE